MARLTAHVRDAAGSVATIGVQLPMPGDPVITAHGREISVGKHNVHALVVDAAGQPIVGAMVSIRPTVGTLSSKHGPVSARTMFTQADGTTGPVAWVFGSEIGHVEFTTVVAGATAIYTPEPCMLTLQSEQISATEWEVWCEFGGTCPGVAITMTIDGDGTWADGSSVVVLLANANGSTNRITAVLTGIATVRASAAGFSDDLILVGGSEPPEQEPEPEPDFQFVVVASGSETSPGEHEVRATVTDLVTGLPAVGVDVDVTPSTGTIEGVAETVATTDVNGQTPLLTWLFDPAVGGDVEFETTDFTTDRYAVGPTDPSDPVPPVPVSYVLDTPAGASFAAQVNQSINIGVRVRDESDLSLESGVVISIAAGSPTPSGSGVGDTSDVNGIATVQFTAGASAGPYVLTVEAPSGDFLDIPITVSVPVIGDSPHYAHMRVGSTDYFFHYPALHPTVSSSVLYDWGGAHFDHVNGGTLSEYSSRNATMHHFFYWLIWSLKPAAVSGIENWLTTNGHTFEDAYLHTVGTSKTFANRVTGTVFGTTRYIMNPGDQGYRAYLAFRIQQICAVNSQGYRFDSVFIDEFNTSIQTQRIPVNTLEYTGRAQYNADWRSMFGILRGLTPLGRLNLNCAAYMTQTEDQLNVIAAGGGQFEFANQPYATGTVSRWNAVDIVTAGGAVVDYASELDISRKGQTSVLNVSGINPGNYNTVAERCVFWEYAAYLMIRDASDVELVVFNPFRDMNADPRTIWFNGLEFDVGDPNGSRGQVGNNIWSRSYDNVLALCRTRASNEFDGGDGGAVTYSLPAGATYRLLNADGSQSGPKTSIQLRVSEAAVLVTS